MAQPRGPNQGHTLGTPQYGNVVWRANATEDGDAIIDPAAIDMSFTTQIINPKSAVDTDGIIDIAQAFGKDANGLEVSFFSDETDEANDTFAIEIYAWRTGSGGGKQVCFSATDTACLLGTMDCLFHPVSGAGITGFWADTIAVTDRWMSPVTVTDSGNNGRAILTYDAKGYRYHQIRIFQAGAGGTEAGRIGAVISAF
jgi:hypothetical protein